MLLVQLIVLSCVIVFVACTELIEENFRGDHSFFKFSETFPATESTDWVATPDQSSPHLRKVSTEGFLPGYLFYSNFGNDATCDHINFREGHVRRLNDCFFGLMYKVGVTANKNYALNILHFKDSSCKVANPSATQTFYFPKNTCVTGNQFFVSSTPSSLADDMYGVGFVYYKNKDKCIANTDWTDSSMIDIYHFKTCFADEGEGVDIYYDECTSDHANVQIYGSVGGQCAGAFNTKQFDFEPVCSNTDIYGRGQPGFYRGFCVYNA